MDDPAADFLPNVIRILRRLQAESEQRDEGMLAFLIDLARAEAEDRLRQAQIDADLRATLRATSTVGFLGEIGRPREPAQAAEPAPPDEETPRRRAAQRRRGRTAL